MAKAKHDDSKVRDSDQMRLEELWSTLHRDTEDFSHGRDGDHMLVCFECDLCIFRKLRRIDPNEKSEKDSLLLACIRRANLDAMWSRSTGTVRDNLGKVKEMIKLSDSVDMESPFVLTKHTPSYDHCGYQIAVLMLMKSLKPGKHSKEYQQFDTIRSLRSAFSNFLRANPTNAGVTQSLGNSEGVYTRLNEDGCGSLWFEKFIKGLRTRMGQVCKPNKALSHELFLLFLSKVESKIENESNQDGNEVQNLLSFHDQWIVFYVYSVVSTVLSLRGSECFLLSLEGLWKHWNRGKGKYVIIPLFGKVKGESGDYMHLIPCVEVTSSGIRIRELLKTFMLYKKSLGIKIGPALVDEKGKIYNISVFDELLHDSLLECFNENKLLFPPDIESDADIQDNYQCFRTFRRTSNTHATANSHLVSESDVVVVNRWKKVEGAKGKRPNQVMQQHYAQFGELIEPFMKYTSIF